MVAVRGQRSVFLLLGAILIVGLLKQRQFGTTNQITHVIDVGAQGRHLAVAKALRVLATKERGKSQADDPTWLKPRKQGSSIRVKVALTHFINSSQLAQDEEKTESCEDIDGGAETIAQEPLNDNFANSTFAQNADVPMAYPAAVNPIVVTVTEPAVERANTIGSARSGSSRTKREFSDLLQPPHKPLRLTERQTAPTVIPHRRYIEDSRIPGDISSAPHALRAAQGFGLGMSTAWGECLRRMPASGERGLLLEVDEQKCFEDSKTDTKHNKPGTLHGFCGPLTIPDRTKYPEPPDAFLGRIPSNGNVQPIDLPRSTQLGIAALQWTQMNLAKVMGNDENAVVVDYAFTTSHEYPFPQLRPSWTFVAASLPPTGHQDAPESLPRRVNHIIWAPPTAHRIRSLAATMNLFDFQFLYRMEDLVEFSCLNGTEILGLLLPMARVSFVVLPCAVDDPVWYMEQAISAMTRLKYLVGLREFEYDIQLLTVLDAFEGDTSACKAPLVRVTTRRVVRGVRHLWCYHLYPFTLKYVLTWQLGDVPYLQNMMPAQLPGGDKRLHKWTPNINLADLLAWGVSQTRRQIFFIDMMHYPAASDPASQNWLVSSGGRVVRIDYDNPKQNVLTGSDYLGLLKLATCTNLPDLQLHCPCCKECLQWGWEKHRFPPLQRCHQCYYCFIAMFSLSRPESPNDYKHCGPENAIARLGYGGGQWEMLCYAYTRDTTDESRRS